MDHNIKTKFTIASEEGVDIFRYLVTTRVKEKYAGIVSEENIDAYLKSKYNRSQIVSELNTFSNQLIIVYVDDVPAGYAFFKGSSDLPEALSGKRSLYLESFEVLAAHQNGKAKEVLMEKCISICKPYHAVWANEHVKESELINLYESHGFNSAGEKALLIGDEVLQSLIYIREN